MAKRGFFVFAGLLAVGGLPALASCNAVTGAGDYRLTGNQEPTDPFINAAGVHIDSIDLYQGIQRPLMKDGLPQTMGVSVVAGRPALLRVFVTTDADYNAMPVTGRLYINDAKEPIVVTQTFMGAPTQDNLDSTLNFHVPGELMTTGMTYRIELKQDPGMDANAKEGTTGWSYPEKDSDPIDVKSTGASLKVVLVPIQYAADGSNRLPDTSPDQLKQYTDEFMGFYPIPLVDIQVRMDPFVWDKQVFAMGGDPNISDWTNLRDAIGDLRQKDAVGDDVYYFGIFNPAANEGQFCGGGCIAGIANLAGPGDAYSRAGIGLGFGGKISTETAIHEIGHTFGREHSPCGGAAGPDPKYPYPMGNTGTCGYAIITEKLFTPESADIMSYCQPYWLSDYTFMKLFDRFVIVNKVARAVLPPEQTDRVYARIRMNGDGTLQWRPTIKLHTPPVGFSTKTITVMTKTGPEVITGQYYPNDHAEGGELLWLPPASHTSSIQVEFKGKVRALAQ